MACNISLLFLSLRMLLLLTAIATYTADLDWFNGGDSKETRDSDMESDQARKKVITATPAIFKGKLYYPENGYLYAVNPMGGTVIWKKNLQNLSGLSPTGLVANWGNCTVSVVTPVIACDLLVVGIYGPAVVIAVNISTGELVWSTRLSSHVASVVAMPGILHQGAFYVGTSSLEEGLGAEICCTFRGSFAKLDASSGAILWQTYTLPVGYAGAAPWGSIPAIDESRKHIYFATASLYTAPSHVRKCHRDDECVEPENYSNSALALDLCTGNVVWSRRLSGNFSSSSADSLEEDDYRDEAPMMLSALQVNQTTERDVVIATNKRGYRWALDRDNGDLVGFWEPPDLKAWLADYGFGSH